MSHRFDCLEMIAGSFIKSHRRDSHGFSHKSQQIKDKKGRAGFRATLLYSYIQVKVSNESVTFKILFSGLQESLGSRSFWNVGFLPQQLQQDLETSVGGRRF